MSYKTKRHIMFLFVILVVASGLGGLGLYLNKKVKGLVDGLATKLTNEIGHPVTITKVTTKWGWLHLNININDLVILDKENLNQLFMVNSIVATVDTFDSLLSLSPKLKKILFNSPRLVLQVDPVNGPMILGLYADNKTNQIDSTFMLRLLSMQRKLSVESGDFHIQGVGGADLPLMKVKFDFKKKSDHEYSIVARGEIAAAVPPEFNFAMNYRGKLEEYSKAMIDFDFKTSNIQIENIVNLLLPNNNFYVSGVFKDLDIMGAVQNGKFRYIKSEFVVDNLNIDKHTDIISGKGNIEFKPVKDRFSFSISNLQVKNHNWFSQIINIDSMRGDVESNFSGSELELWTKNLTIKLAGIELLPTIKAKLQNNILSSLEITNKNRSAHVAKVLRLLPDKKIPSGLISWLNKALLDGFIQGSNLKYNNKKLYWDLDFKQTTLKYSDNWANIDNLDAVLIFDDEKLSIIASQSYMLGHKLNSLSAAFLSSDNRSYDSIMINGDIDATLEDGMDFLKGSPLKDNVLSKIKAFNPSGNMHLAIDLGIDFNDDSWLAVNGNLDIKQSKVELPELELALNDINGNINFTRDTLTSHNLSLQLFNKLAHAEVMLGADKTKGLQVKLIAPLNIEDLKQKFSILNTPHISGHTDIVAHIQMPWDSDSLGAILNISSNLQGVSLDYPVPFHKLAADKLAFELKYLIKDYTDQTLYISLAKLLEANILLRDKKFAGGHVFLGVDKNLDFKKGGLLISGKIDSFNWDIWQFWLQKNTKDNSFPFQVDLLINKLDFYGGKYKAMMLKYDSSNNKLTLDNPIITGTILFAKDEDKIELKLSNLDLGATQLKNNKFLQTIKEKNRTKQLPLIQFYCERLLLNQKEYNKVNVELLPRTYGYDITDFSMSNENVLLQAQGQWQMDTKESTQIAGSAYTKNFGKVLTDWGYGNSMTKGDGELNFSLHWKGNPMNFDLFNLAGDSHIELRSGNLTGVNSGLGRIIGLLTLESIQRRIKLDFSDLFSKGYAFDKLISDIKLQPGILSSENIVINSPSARIELAGKTILKKQELDFTMQVIPKVSLGLPVAAAVAVGNPAIGAAIWLFDQASGSRIGVISKYKYKVTGTWTEPKIEEIIQKK